MVMLTLSLVMFSGCGTEYVKGDNAVSELQRGDKAPHAGFLLTPNAYLDIMECCDRCLGEE